MVADPRSDARWNVSQHRGQSVLAAEEAGRSLERRKEEESLNSARLFFSFLAVLLNWF